MHQLLNSGRLLVVALLFVSGTLFGEAPDYLETEDIPLVMQEVFEHHVDHKELTPQLAGRILKIYIEQFDAEKIYLLERETDSYLYPSQRMISRLMERLERNDLATFEKLNRSIQKAIRRSRSIRYRLQQNLDELFAAKLPEPPTSDELDKRTFAKTEDELEQRIRDQLIVFISFQRKALGEETIKGREQEVIDLYERNLRVEENKYLYVDKDGQPLASQEQEHLFTLHVIKALTSSLDAHTSFFSYAEAYDMKVRLEKGFKGVGIVLQESIDGVTITRLIDGGPAQKSGKIRDNDRIIGVNGVNIVGEAFEDVLDLIRGEEGSVVDLRIKRTLDSGSEEFNVALKREQIEISEKRVDTSYQRFGDGIIGRIKLYSFYHGDNGVSSVRDVRNAIRDFYKQGNVKGIVLDLRDNTGGFLMQAVKVAGLFITNGVVVVAKYGDGEMRYFRDIDGHSYFDGPLVVLTSRGSASAAEIVAQALQDYGAGLIVGDESTYGKGSIQHQTVTDSNSHSYFKVTIGRYYTVSGRSTQIDGVKADIVVPTAVNKERLGERYLDYALSSDLIAESYDDELLDLDFEAQRWYRKYYTPSIQAKLKKWQAMLPILRENSQYRLQHNKNYREFMEDLGLELVDIGEEEEEPELAADGEIEINKESYGSVDLQMQEATSILKDMILMNDTGAHLKPVANGK